MPTRSPSSGRSTHAASDVGGRSATVLSRSSVPLMQSRSSAASRTLRVMGPIWSRLEPNATSPHREMRPYVGFSPTIPQNAAGCLIEPPVSLPIAAAHRPAATAAALPALLPPGTRPVSHGFATRPQRQCSPEEPMANSSRLVLPTTTAPARSRRSTAVASNGDR